MRCKPHQLKNSISWETSDEFHWWYTFTIYWWVSNITHSNIICVYIPVVLLSIDGIQHLECLPADGAIVGVNDGHDVALAAVLLDPEEHVAQRAQVLQSVHNLDAVGQPGVGLVQVVEDLVGRLVGRGVIHVHDVEVGVVLLLQRLEEQLVGALGEDVVARGVHAHAALLLYASDLVFLIVVIVLFLV